MNANNNLNKQVFDTLKENMGEVLPMLMDAFLEDSTILLQEIHDGIKTSNTENILSATHTLKSSAKNMGADQLSAYCSEIENILQDDDQAFNQNSLLNIQELASSEMEIIKPIILSWSTLESA